MEFVIKYKGKIVQRNKIILKNKIMKTESEIQGKYEDIQHKIRCILSNEKGKKDNRDTLIYLQGEENNLRWVLGIN